MRHALDSSATHHPTLVQLLQASQTNSDPAGRQDLLCTSVARYKLGSYNAIVQVLTIASVRPASLTAFFNKQHASQGSAQAKACEVPELLANALPWVLHSLQTHTGNPNFPPSFLEWLMLSCIAATVKCAEAVTGTFYLCKNIFVLRKSLTKHYSCRTITYTPG